MRLLYVDLGGVKKYSCDKTAGRILGWILAGISIDLLGPYFMRRIFEENILKMAEDEKKLHIFSAPYSSIETPNSLGIVLTYLWRIISGPLCGGLWRKKYYAGFSNSPVLVDIVPILILKIFKRCDHWILMFDSSVPPPSNRSGNWFINKITYLESRSVVFLAKNFASLTFTVNPVLKQELSRLGIPNQNIALSKNGLFINQINSPDHQSNDLKKYDAAYMGRITENKGVYDLLAAWKILVQRHPNIILAVMGTGRSESLAKFQKKIKNLELENNIKYFGYVSGYRKYGILKQSKVFLFLSRVNADESWGISLMEAMACGLPAVTYNLEVYKHVYLEGLLLSSTVGDIEGIANNIDELFEHENLRLSLGKKSKEFAEGFNWPEIAREDLRLIEQLYKLN